LPASWLARHNAVERFPRQCAFRAVLTPLNAIERLFYGTSLPSTSPPESSAFKGYEDEDADIFSIRAASAPFFDESSSLDRGKIQMSSKVTRPRFKALNV
jgi:hypothetical protein